MKIAIMQPYFIPYLGYFRLFKQTDLFVIYDCVQFPRRGWVHRNQVQNPQGQAAWLSLPLAKQPMTIAIKDLKFSAQAENAWQKQLNKFPQLTLLKTNYPSLYQQFIRLDQDPLTYIVACLKEVCQLLDLHFNISYSSTLNLPTTLRGQDRILKIANHFQATDYINAPGGRQLYSDAAFKAQGINLHFLPEFNGSFWSIVHMLVTQDLAHIKQAI